MTRPNRWSFLHRSDSRRARSARRRCLPQIDLLERRDVPTIFFGTPTETVNNGGGPLLDNVHVRLVFWGPQWNTTTNQALAHNFEASVDTILGSNYLSGLEQYSSALGSGRVGTTFVTNSSPPSTIDSPGVKAMLRANIEGTIPGDPGDDPHNLYYVVPPPGTKAVKDSHDTPPEPVLGLHNHAKFPDPHDGAQDTFHYGLTENDGVLDTLTNTFSHELVESITDPEGDGITVNISAPEGEISDNDAQKFFARLDGNGPIVQSYLSVADKAFIIPTKHLQSLHVNDFRTVIVDGDQLSNPNDTITIDEGDFGGVRVTLNGETTEFGSGIIDKVVVNAGNGSDTVNIDQTKNIVVVHLGDGADTVNISPSSKNLDTVKNIVLVSGDGGSDKLHLFDQANTAKATYTINEGSVTRSSANIQLDHVENIVIDGGSAADSFQVGATEADTNTTLNGGSGDNVFFVKATAAGSVLGLNGGADADKFIVGSFGLLQTLDDIAGTVRVDGGSGANADTLELRDSDNSDPATYEVKGSLFRRGAAQVIEGGIENVSITGGKAANTFNVESVLDTTALSLVGGPQNDTFKLSPTANDLNLIRHLVKFDGGDGKNTLTAIDDAFAAATTFQVDAPLLSRNGKELADFGTGINSVTVFAGNGANTFNVERTLANVQVNLFGGADVDNYVLAPKSRNLNGIQGPVTLIGGDGKNNLTAIDDAFAAATTFQVELAVTEPQRQGTRRLRHRDQERDRLRRQRGQHLQRRADPRQCPGESLRRGRR